MGNLLEKPVEDIHGCEGSFELQVELLDANDGESKSEPVTLDHLYALSYMQGWRVTMEDSHIVLPSLPANDELGFKEVKSAGFFAVFDGHGGDTASKFAEAQFFSILQTSSFYPKLLKALEEEESTGNETKSAQLMGELMQDAVLLTDERLRHETGNARIGGATAVMCFITGRVIVVANLGDSRALLCKKRTSGEPNEAKFEFRATKDHKPTEEGERARVVAAGMSVINQRIGCDLALSRALGDFGYKSVSNLGPFDQPVSAKTDIYTFKRDSSDAFLCLACDGIWDIMSNAQVCDFVLSRMNNAVPLKNITDEMMSHCIEGKDNMSSLLISLAKVEKPSHAK